MVRKGWHHESGRHSLAARGVRTSHKVRSVPIKSARHGPRASTVKKWTDERLESFRKKLNKRFDYGEGDHFEKDNNWIVVTEVGKNKAGDYVELRTDSNSYDVLYNPTTGDYGFLENQAYREFFKPFQEKFPGMYWERMGGGVMRAYLWNYHGDIAEAQEARANEAMESKISKHETDYTGEYSKGH